MRKRALYHFFIFCVIMLFSAQPSTAKERAGRISALQGSAIVSETNMKDRAARIFEPLNAGDRITLGKGAVVRIIFYSDYHEEMIKGTGIAEIQRTSAVNAKGSKCVFSVTRRPQIGNLPDNPYRNGQSIAAGAVKGTYIAVRGSLENCYRMPVFTWPAMNGVRFYRITISTLDGDSEFEAIDAITEENSYRVPEEKKLRYGTRYRLKVVGYENNPGEPFYEGVPDNIKGSNRDAPYYFMIPTKKGLALLDKEEKRLKTLKKGSPGWSSSASLLLIALMEYGLVERAGILAEEMIRRGITQDDVRRIARDYPGKKS